MKMCYNGCNKPICPPSKVICKDCMDKISKFMEAEIARLEGKTK